MREDVMTGMETERDLLLGAAALEGGIVDRGELREALRTWLKDDESSLGGILVDRAAISETEHDELRQTVASKLDESDWEFKVWDELTRETCCLPGNENECETVQEGGLKTGTHPVDVEPEGLSRYRILRPYAQGGLGRIFLALDVELGRRVALKEIRPRHAGNATSRQRFLAEARITGRLEHPGIVPVHGMGVHGDGRPYYAMRFINGEDLATAIHRFYAGTKDFASLEFRWLLRRFIDVCDTISYAHSRGVIHRDLKPSNIMLGPYGETLVMDWGVARPMSGPELVGGSEGEGSSSRETIVRPLEGEPGTMIGQAVGTPAYMSPEQAVGDHRSVGPASDIYSLGATLYVLLTDRRPFEGELEDILDDVRDGRFTPPRELNRRAPAALEAICLRAMATDPAMRYPTAQALGIEIEHFLADEPVSAWPDPWTVRLRRWVRRHYPLVASSVAASGVALISLAVAVPLLSLAWHNAREQRASALSHERIASQERDRAESTLRFLVSAFRKPDPTVDGRAIKVVDLLDQAVQDLDRSAGDQPLMSATLLAAIGKTYIGLGMAKESLAAFDRSRETRSRLLGDDHPDTLESLHGRAQALQDAGRLDQAIPILETTLARRTAILGGDHPSVIESLNDLAVAYWQADRIPEAVELQQQALAIVRTKLGDDHLDTLTIMDNLAVAHAASGHPEKAVPLHEKTLALLQAKLGPLHPTTLVTLNNLGRALEALGQVDRAIALHQQTLENLKSKLEEDHPTTLSSMHGLARALARAGRSTEAIRLFEKTLSLREARLGVDHPDSLATLSALAWAYEQAGRHSNSKRLARTFLERARSIEAHLPGSLRAEVEKAKRLLGSIEPKK